MNQFDLIPFAEHSQKLPGKYLAPIAKKETASTWKILASHSIDFGLTFVATSVMTLFFSQSVKTVLVTRSLQMAFSENDVSSLAGPLIPLMVFSYFFFCYFMNHGQTLGMMLFKRRIDMQSKSFYEAAKWAAYSFFLVMTCGLSYLFGKSKWQNIKRHDYLYEDLITYKEVSPINLLSKIEEIRASEKVIEEDWVKAA